MAVLGRLSHPSMVPLKAYYYVLDEKLLVYEFMPKGSLFSLLHGKLVLLSPLRASEELGLSPFIPSSTCCFCWY
jgi:serine/threonine protein kinase